MGTGEEVMTGIVNRLYKPVLHSASEEREECSSVSDFSTVRSRNCNEKVTREKETLPCGKGA